MNIENLIQQACTVNQKFADTLHRRMRKRKKLGKQPIEFKWVMKCLEDILGRDYVEEKAREEIAKNTVSSNEASTVSR